MIAIRSARASDAARIAEIYAYYVEQTTISFEEIAPSEGEMAQRMARAGDRYPWLVASVDNAGEIAGYAYAGPHSDRAAYRWSVNVSVYLDERSFRRGVGRRLYVSLFEILTAQGYVNAYAGITQPNVASVALHESLGFVPVGTYRDVGYKGAWLDVIWYAKRLRAPDDPPSETKSIVDATREPRL